MSLRIKEKSAEQMLNDYLDTIYLQSHSASSKKTYRTAIVGKENGFRIFLKEKYNCDEVQLAFRIQNNELDIYNILSEYVIFLDKKSIKPKTIRLWLTIVKGYYTYMGIDVFAEKCKQRVKLPKIKRLKKEALTKEILIKLLHNQDPKLQSAVLLALSSGLRVGEITGLTLPDIEFNAEPVKINVRAETSKSGEDRETYISKEASEALRDYLQRFFGWREDSPNKKLQSLRIFGRTNRIRTENDSRLPTPEEQLSESIILQKALIRAIRKVPELNKLGRNGRRVIHFHAFREFFYTVVSNVSGSDYAHALLGHHEYLDTYYTLSKKEQVRLYKNAEPHVTISDFAKIEKSLENMQNKQTDILEKYEAFERYLRQKDPAFLEFLKIKEFRK